MGSWDSPGQLFAWSWGPWDWAVGVTVAGAGLGRPHGEWGLTRSALRLGLGSLGQGARDGGQVFTF